MEVTILQKAIESMIEQGVLGTILVILFLLFKKFIEKLFIVVDNNTKAQVKTAEVLNQMRETMLKCNGGK
jgi:hypothetical protein